MTASTQTAAAKEMAEVLPLVKEHPSIHAALVAALAELTVVEKGRTANAGSYSYDYADLADVVKLTRPVLARHGLAALTPIHDHGQGLACTVKLVWSGGDTLDLGPFPFPPGRDAQATGSWVTYARRYALVAALGMATGEDDDGARAHPAPPEPTLTQAQHDRRRRMDLVKHLANVDPTDEASKKLAREAWEFMAGDSMEGFDEDAITKAFTAFMTTPPEGEGE